MDASHFLVGGLTAVMIALLVWIEIRSRRNIAKQDQARLLLPNCHCRNCSHDRKRKAVHAAKRDGVKKRLRHRSSMTIVF